MMAVNLQPSGGRSGNGLRIAGWSAAALFLLYPLVAMQFTDEVDWDAADFLLMGALLGGVGLGLELAIRTTANRAYRAAASLALASAFLLLWINAAVGMFGSENDPANLLFGGVLAVAFSGAVVARFRPRGLAFAMAAAALAQALVPAIASVFQLMPTASSGWAEALTLTAGFTAMWLLSAWLFWKAAA
jgi:hypothetical protein